MDKELELKLTEIKEGYEAKAAAAGTNAAKAEVAEQMKAVDLKLSEIRQMPVDISEDQLKKSLEDVNTLIRDFESFQLEAKQKAGKKDISFGDALGEQLEKSKEQLNKYKTNRNPINFELKVVGNLGAGNLTTSGTETFSGNTFLGLGRKPYEIAHIRNFVPSMLINTDSAYVIRDAAGEGGPTAVAMAAAKPQSDRDYVKLIQPVTKIAHYFKIPEEMLADNSWLQGEISGVGIEDLLAKEDDLLLNQVAGAGLFAGLLTATNSTAFAAPASLALAIEAANNYDVLVAAWTQLKVLKNSANYVLCNPADYARMVLTKATTGEYVFGAPNVSIPNIFGIPLVPHNSITSDKFALGGFSKVKICQREGVSVRFYDQNEDDAIKNMVIVVIEERLTIVADRADRIIYGDFSDGRAALETP